MKSKIDEIISEVNESYEEFLRSQFIVDLNIGDKVKIQVFDENNKLLTDKEFEAKYVNCHINCQWQDKGIKKEI